MESYTELFAQLKTANDSWECVGPQPASRVDEIERKYSIQLPTSFRNYLTELGGIEFLDAHYTSIDDDYLDDSDGFTVQHEHDSIAVRHSRRFDCTRIRSRFRLHRISWT